MSLFHDTNSLKKILQKNPDCYRPLYDTSMGRKLKRLFILLLKQALFDQDTFLPMGKNNYMYFIKDVLTMDVAIRYFGRLFYDEAIIEFRLMRDLNGKSFEEIQEASSKVDLNQIQVVLKKELTLLHEKMLKEAEAFMWIGEPQMPNDLGSIIIPYYENRSPHLWNVNHLLKELLGFVFSKSIFSDSLQDYEKQISTSKVDDLFERWEDIYILYSYHQYLEYIKAWCYLGEPEFHYKVQYSSAAQACAAVIVQAKKEGLILTKAQMAHYCSMKARDTKGKIFSEDALKKAYDRYHEENS